MASLYVQQYKQGPFPQTVDPWSEAGRYFHQIHSAMIDSLQDQLQDALIERGYQAGREASVQIFSARQPVVYIQRVKADAPPVSWDYGAAAAALALEAGTRIIEDMPERLALHVYAAGSSELVMVMEIISPSNKTSLNEMLVYQEERNRIFLNQRVNVVEIDLTRSVKQLVSHALTQNHAYHTAIFIPGDLPRVLVSNFGEALKPFALPLRGEVLPVDLMRAYTQAYQRGAIAGLILKETGYTAGALPFPSLLDEAQQHVAFDAVAAWKAELIRVQSALS